ncbi:MAG: hypothetical protein LBF80_01310 [Spirochaetaceae bacterium]|jgi:hypothetical protein|nr:hypothetical protein [Spirochaetaceae bacterium]
MPAGIYQKMLDEFGDTLEQTSEDRDEKTTPKGGGVFMTSCQEKVVNFDKFKNSIAAKFALANNPNSCDALYMQAENDWFFIELKTEKLTKR